MGTSATHYDVAVVGYGPTGVTAANLLGARGLSILVVERDESIYGRARAISTDEEVLRIWQQLGLADRLKADMLPDKPLDFVDAQGRSFISARANSWGHGHAPQQFIYQPALEQTLRDGAQRYPNVEVRTGHECTHLDQDAEAVTLTVRDIADDTTSTVTASYVIAADGGSSPMRTQLGIGFEGRTYEDRWVVIDCAMREPWPTHDRLRFHCDPTRPAVDCPTPLGHHRWEFPVLPGEDEAELVTDAAVWRLLNRYGITEANVEILRAVVYSHHVRFAARWRAQRVFLAGDAAHVMPPWIGQGMAAGVRDAANLCWKIAAVLDGSLPADVLDSYETERQPHVREVTRRAVFVGRIITERRPLLTALRNPLFRALGSVTAVNRYVQRANWIPEPRYGRGYFVPGGAAGRRFPQPRVLGPDGRRVLLDDVLGGEWTILRTAAGAAPADWVETGTSAFEVRRTGRPGAGVIVDDDGTLTRWMNRYGVATLAVRPDGYVYSAAAAGRPLATPPLLVPLAA